MRPILITGSTGTLGRAFARGCDERGLAFELTARTQLDIADPDSVARALAHHEPWLVINTAGYVRVDDAETDEATCRRENVLGPTVLARACARDRVPLVSFSSDLVFDGRKQAAYDERDRPSPLGVYGRTKYEAEQQILDAHDAALVVRTSGFFGPWDAYNFVTVTLRELAAGASVRAAADVTMSATYIPDLVHACLDLAIDGDRGVWHLANLGETTWAELARSAAALAGHEVDRIVPVPSSELAWRAPRPAFSALHSARALLMPTLADALGRFQQARREQL
jgi:dTDP-4-dehydrorhamnose reductase